MTVLESRSFIYGMFQWGNRKDAAKRREKKLAGRAIARLDIFVWVGASWVKSMDEPLQDQWMSHCKINE